ncbi:MAG: NAD(P)-dependent oxidoreductase [Caldilineaceae bacterium]|nr:NAD(P)-dependent oxidoreductase [Caldilineaceae bacterium]
MQPYPPLGQRSWAGVKRVLVTGGAGYIGSALLPKLLESGYQVRLLDLFIFGREPLGELVKHPNLEIVSGDFRDRALVEMAMREVDAVVHLGAIVGDPACELDHHLTIEINLGATLMIAEVAKYSGVERFVFASTCSVYGASDEFLNEGSTLNPLSLYSITKIAAEESLTELSGPNFCPTFLRFGTIYGLSGRTRFDLVVNLLAAKALLEGEITVFGGDQWRPFLHVDDAALAVHKVLEAPKSIIYNQAFNVGSDEQNFTIDQIAQIVNAMIPSARIVNMGVDMDQRNYRVDFHKTRATLAFHPHWSVESGIQQVIDGIRRGDIQDYSDIRYSNVKFFRQQAIPSILDRWTEHHGAVGDSGAVGSSGAVASNGAVGRPAGSYRSAITALLNDRAAAVAQYAR